MNRLCVFANGQSPWSSLLLISQASRRLGRTRKLQDLGSTQDAVYVTPRPEGSFVTGPSRQPRFWAGLSLAPRPNGLLTQPQMGQAHAASPCSLPFGRARMYSKPARRGPETAKSLALSMQLEYAMHSAVLEYNEGVRASCTTARRKRQAHLHVCLGIHVQLLFLLPVSSSDWAQQLF